MVKMLTVIRKYISCLFILIKIIVIYVSGCIYDKNEITIGLDNTTPMLGWEAYVEIRPVPCQFSGFHNNT